MHEVIVRGSLFTAQFALPYLQKAANPRIIHLAPKISLLPKWFKGHTAYTMFKYSSAMMVIGHAEEFKEYKIAVNAVWPKTLLATAAVQNLLGGDKAIAHSRHPRIVADAVHHLVQKPLSHSGNFHLDEELVVEQGIDLAEYNMTPGSKLITDLYVDE
jgi:citronellol/citronellal dehydrogenase